MKTEDGWTEIEVTGPDELYKVFLGIVLEMTSEQGVDYPEALAGLTVAAAMVVASAPELDGEAMIKECVVAFERNLREAHELASKARERVERAEARRMN